MPAPPSDRDPTHSLIACHARACLADLQLQHAPYPEAVVHAGGGWTVLIAAFPTPTPESTPPGLTECDRDCLVLLAQVQEPLSGAKVRKELESRRIGIHGLVTVKRSLARLKRLGLVCNSRKRPRGYWLPDVLPLVLRRHAAAAEGD